MDKTLILVLGATLMYGSLPFILLGLRRFQRWWVRPIAVGEQVLCRPYGVTWHPAAVVAAPPAHSPLGWVGLFEVATARDHFILGGRHIRRRSPWAGADPAHLDALRRLG